MNHPPALTVEKPLSSFARPTVDFAARCEDDDAAGCASLVVTLSPTGGLPSTVLASGTQAVAGTEDLSAFEGETATLRFEAVDSDGARTSSTRVVIVDSRPVTTSVARLVATVSGQVLDADGTRVLHRSGLDGMAVTDLALGHTTIMGATASPGAGFLTDQGALFVDGTPGSFGEVMEWRGQGAAAHLGFTDSPGASLRHAGSFAVWQEADVPGRTRPPGLVRRDLAAGTEVHVADTALAFDLAANGDVVFSVFHEVSRYRDTVELLATDLVIVHQSPSPVTDGVRAAWREGDARFNNTLHVWDGSAVPIATDLCGGYAVEGPWVAFVRGSCFLGMRTGTRVWRLGPAGEEAVGGVGLDEELGLLLPDGTVLLSAGHRYYLAVPGQPPVEVGTTEIRPVARGGRIYLLLGASVYEVVR